MKLIPHKDFVENGIRDTADQEFIAKVTGMLKAPNTAEPIEVPVGFFDRNPSYRTNWSQTFHIDDSEELQRAAADRKAKDEVTAKRAKEDADAAAKPAKKTDKTE